LPNYKIGQGTIGGNLGTSTSAVRALTQAENVFAPDVILPEQYHDRISNTGCESVGEKSLMLAVLEDGIRCLQGTATDMRRRKHLLYAQAYAWVDSQDATWTFSFENICLMLDLNADVLRKKLLQPKPVAAPPSELRLVKSHRVVRGTARPTPTLRRAR